MPSSSATTSCSRRWCSRTRPSSPWSICWSTCRMPSSTPAFSTSPASPSAPHGAVGRWLRRDPIAAAAAGFLLTLLVLALLSATLTGYAYDQQDLNHPFLGPSVAHLLGTDQYGR